MTISEKHIEAARRTNEKLRHWKGVRKQVFVEVFTKWMEMVKDTTTDIIAAAPSMGVIDFGR